MKTALEIGNSMLAAGKQPMTDDEAKALIRLMMMPEDFELSPEKLAESPLALKIAKGRAKHVGLDVEDRVLLMVAILSTSPGDVVLYCAALRAIQEKMGGGRVTLDDFSTVGFPWGFPSREDMHKIWDSQKGEPGEKVDNWLDKQEA